MLTGLYQTFVHDVLHNQYIFTVRAIETVVVIIVWYVVLYKSMNLSHMCEIGVQSKIQNYSLENIVNITFFKL